MNRSWLTTIDNPFNPFTQFNDWLRFDTEKNYNTCQYLARLATVSPDLSDQQNQSSINQAIDSILRVDVLGLYKSVSDENVDKQEDTENEK